MPAAGIEVGQPTVTVVFPFAINVPRPDDTHLGRMRSCLGEEAAETPVEMVIAGVPPARPDHAVICGSHEAWKLDVAHVSNVCLGDADVLTALGIVHNRRIRTAPIRNDAGLL